MFKETILSKTPKQKIKGTTLNESFNTNNPLHK